jgi:dimethylhistidine N-methyltransferase
LLAEVVEGLSGTPKALPPKLFYDERGSALFSAICGTAAYYLTRTEETILRGRAREIAEQIGPGCALIEPGAGEMRKVRHLLPALAPRAYAAFDLSRAQLVRSAEELARDFPGLQVYAVHGDYQSGAIERLPLPAAPRRVIFFPGSTIGNFEPSGARTFLARAREVAGRGGGLLIGVDLQKDKAVLDLAYNDPDGYTAAFNLNVLARINRELGANFDLRAFSHLAFYNSAAARIEMHLVSAREQRVRVAGHTFNFAPGGTIHTENSYKYSIGGFQQLAREAGFGRVARWTDEREWFAVFYLAASGLDGRESA